MQIKSVNTCKMFKTVPGITAQEILAITVDVGN